MIETLKNLFWNIFWTLLTRLKKIDLSILGQVTHRTTWINLTRGCNIWWVEESNFKTRMLNYLSVIGGRGWSKMDLVIYLTKKIEFSKKIWVQKYFLDLVKKNVYPQFFFQIWCFFCISEKFYLHIKFCTFYKKSSSVMIWMPNF